MSMNGSTVTRLKNWLCCLIPHLINEFNTYWQSFITVREPDFMRPWCPLFVFEHIYCVVIDYEHPTLSSFSPLSIPALQQQCLHINNCWLARECCGAVNCELYYISFSHIITPTLFFFSQSTKHNTDYISSHVIIKQMSFFYPSGLTFSPGCLPCCVMHTYPI